MSLKVAAGDVGDRVMLAGLNVIPTAESWKVTAAGGGLGKETVRRFDSTPTVTVWDEGRVGTSLLIVTDPVLMGAYSATKKKLECHDVTKKK